MPWWGDKETPSCKVHRHSLKEKGKFLCLEETIIAPDVQTWLNRQAGGNAEGYIVPDKAERRKIFSWQEGCGKMNSEKKIQETCWAYRQNAKFPPEEQEAMATGHQRGRERRTDVTAQVALTAALGDPASQCPGAGGGGLTKGSFWEHQACWQQGTTVINANTHFSVT